MGEHSKNESEGEHGESSAGGLGRELLTEAWTCTRCAHLSEFFEADANCERWFRFPPIIGCQRSPLLLFVGINPRVSYSGRAQNDELHRRILSSFSEFEALSDNCDGHEAYIAESGGEPYYRPLAELAAQVLRGTPLEGKRFEEIASSTELFLCGTTVENARHLPILKAPCASHFLPRIFGCLRPKAVVAVGDQVRDYLRVAFGTDGRFEDVIFSVSSGDWRSPVFTIPHPRFWQQVEASIVEAIRVALFSKAAPNDAQLGEVADHPGVAAGPGVDIVRYEWNPRYGWKPHHKPAHLLWLEGDVNRRIRYELTRNAKVRVTLEMSGRDLRDAIGSYTLKPEFLTGGYWGEITSRRNSEPTETLKPKWARFMVATK